MNPKEIHLKYEKYVFFTKAFVGSSNLYSKKLIFLLFVQLGGVEGEVDTLSSPPAIRRDNPFYSLKAN